MNTLTEIQCPYCWQVLPIEVDPQGGRQEFTEDCHVCCRPIRIAADYNEISGDFSIQCEKES